MSSARPITSRAQTPENEQHVLCPNHTTESALVRKLDLRLIPVLSILNVMAFLDKVNISNALTLGMPKELGLVGNQVNCALAIFFVPFVIFEIPSNLFLKHFKPHVWLSGCMFFFGFVMTMQGFVHNYSALLATRFFLGLAEAGVFPGCFYLISMWYKREEAQKRFTLLFGSTTFAGAVGSLLASGIENMDGIRGYSGWRWIFILEGITTCVFSVIAYFIILDFPEDSQWLREDEKVFMTARLQPAKIDSCPTVSAKSMSRTLLTFFTDIKTFCGAIPYFGMTIAAYGLSYFIPTIVKGYGYSDIQTQLHSTPPFAVAWVVSVALAVFSDKLQLRSLPLALALAIAMAGSIILLVVKRNTSLEYGALFLLASGTYSSIPILICWYTMNLPEELRSVGTGWQIGFGNIGAIVATFSFTAADAPFYHKGYSIIMVGLCIAIASSFIYWIVIFREIRIRSKIERENQDLQSDDPLGRYQERTLYL